jgi:hypothetical protein
MLQNGKARLTDPKQIEDHVLDYFQGIFCVENNCITNDLVGNMIPLLVTDRDNLMLTSAFAIDDIKRAVFDLNGDGSPGRMDLGDIFFFRILLLRMWFSWSKISSI